MSEETTHQKASLKESTSTAATKIKAGDILYSIWGYSMTRASFYKVLKMSPSGKTATIAKLKATYVNNTHIVDKRGVRGGEYTEPTEILDMETVRSLRVNISHIDRDEYLYIKPSEILKHWNGKKVSVNTYD